MLVWRQWVFKYREVKSQQKINKYLIYKIVSLEEIDVYVCY